MGGAIEVIHVHAIEIGAIGEAGVSEFIRRCRIASGRTVIGIAEVDMLQVLVALEGMGIHVGGIVVVSRSVVGHGGKPVMLREIVVVGFHDVHVVDGAAIHIVNAPERALVEIIAVVGSPGAASHGFLIILVHYDGQLGPYRVVLELIIAVATHIYLQVGASVKDMGAHEAEIVGSQRTGGVGAVGTFHKHVEALQVGASCKCAVGHGHLECGLGITEGSPALDVLEGNLLEILVASHTFSVHAHGAVMVGGAHIVVYAHLAIVFFEIVIVHLADIEVVHIVNLAVFGSTAPPVHGGVVVGQHLADEVSTRVAVCGLQFHGVVGRGEGLVGGIEVQRLEGVADGEVLGRLRESCR